MRPEGEPNAMKTFLASNGSGVSRAARGADGRWTVSQVLAGQRVVCLAVDARSAASVYAGTQSAGVFHSADGGQTWTQIGLAGQTVKALAASPLVPGLLFAGTRPARLYLSHDAGQNWEECASFRKIFSRRFWFSPAEAPFQAYIQGIALSPTDPNLIVAGIEAGAVVRSTDGGQTWQDHRPGALRDCHSITFHAAQGNWVYEAGGTGAGSAVSQDGGSTWVQRRAGLDRHYGWACAADPARPEISYLSAAPSPMKAHSAGDAQACIFRSNPDQKWEKLGGGLPQPLAHMPYALITDPGQPGHVYAGLSSGEVWFSPDMGDAWEPLPFRLNGINRSMVLLA